MSLPLSLDHAAAASAAAATTTTTTATVAVPSSSSSSSAYTKVAFLIQSTYQDLEIRSQVHEVLQGMLWDVEVTAHLQDQWEQEEEQAQWVELLQHQRYELEQSQKISKRSQQACQQWADQLVKELWLFSQDYGRLLDQQQTTTLHLQRELEQTKEQLAAALAVTTTTARASQLVTTPTVTAETASATTTPATTTTASAPIPVGVTTVPSQDEQHQAITSEINTAVSSDSKDSTSKSDNQETNDEGKIFDKNSGAPTVVSLISPSEEEDEHEVKDADHKEVSGTLSSSAVAVTTTKTTTPTLVGLEIELLMHIFGFLDALDILNTAQVNIAMYSKVDSLFGLGANSNNSSNNLQNDVSDESEMDVAVSPPTAATANTAMSTTPRTAETTKSAATTNTLAPAAPVPPPAAVATATQTKAASTTDVLPSSSSLLLGGGKGLFSLLSSSAAATAASKASHKPSGSSSSFPLGILSSSSSTSATTSTPLQQQPHDNKHHPQPWTRSMADSLAKKLTDAEMSAIISMTVRLRTRNQEVDQLKQERDELLGKVQGMETIRQFLLDKIRQVQLTLNKTRDDTVRVTQQSASDQEVIAFLDTRVQELEREVENLTKTKQQVQDEANQTHALLTQKVSVLSDLLQFERERYRDHDREAKATKKVLVKEVKQCRAQIVTLQAQRDGVVEENDKLRNAILSTTTTTSNNNSNSNLISTKNT